MYIASYFILKTNNTGFKLITADVSEDLATPTADSTPPPKVHTLDSGSDSDTMRRYFLIENSSSSSAEEGWTPPAVMPPVSTDGAELSSHVW